LKTNADETQALKLCIDLLRQPQDWYSDFCWLLNSNTCKTKEKRNIPQLSSVFAKQCTRKSRSRMQQIPLQLVNFKNCCCQSKRMENIYSKYWQNSQNMGKKETHKDKG